MKMSYRKAWLLLKALEETFGAPLVATSTGGKAGGGARLTPLGTLVASRYRSLESSCGQGGKRRSGRFWRERQNHISHLK